MEKVEIINEDLLDGQNMISFGLINEVCSYTCCLKGKKLKNIFELLFDFCPCFLFLQI